LARGFAPLFFAARAGCAAAAVFARVSHLSGFHKGGYEQAAGLPGVESAAGRPENGVRHVYGRTSRG